MPEAPPSTLSRPPGLAELFMGFLLIGVCGFGGVLPWARRMIVEQRRWMTGAEFTDMLGLCQFLPGGNIMNVTIALGSMSTMALSINGADIETQAGADAANTAIGNAIDRIQTMRAGVGASENRVDFAAANVSTTIENTEAARSNLVDLDVASASSNLASQKILTQAGIAMMKRASEAPKSLLKLLV